MYAVVRDNQFDLAKLADGNKQIAEFQAAHASQPGYLGSLTVDAGNGRQLTITLWQNEPLAAAARAALEPVVQRLLLRLMAAPSKLVGVGEVLFNDVASS